MKSNSNISQLPNPEEWNDMSHAEKIQHITQVESVFGPVIEKYRNASLDEIKQAIQRTDSTTEVELLQILQMLKTNSQ